MAASDDKRHEKKYVCQECTSHRLDYIYNKIISFLNNTTGQFIRQMIPHSEQVKSKSVKLEIARKIEPSCSGNKDQIRFKIAYDNIVFFNISTLNEIIKSLQNLPKAQEMRVGYNDKKLQCCDELPVVEIENFYVYNCEHFQFRGCDTQNLCLIVSGTCYPSSISFKSTSFDIENIIKEIIIKKTLYLTHKRMQVQSSDILSLKKLISYKMTTYNEIEGEIVPQISLTHPKLQISGLANDTSNHLEITEYNKFDVTFMIEIFERCDIKDLLDNHLRSINIGKISWVLMNIFFEKTHINNLFISYSACEPEDTKKRDDDDKDDKEKDSSSSKKRFIQ